MKEFPELVLCGENSKLLEVGCGNGSTVLPILRYHLIQIFTPTFCYSEFMRLLNYQNLFLLPRVIYAFLMSYFLNQFPAYLLLCTCTSFIYLLLVVCSGSKNIRVYACDCSSEALARTKENISRAAIPTFDNFHSFSCDFSTSSFPNWVACHHCRRNQPCCHHSGFSPFHIR